MTATPFQIRTDLPSDAATVFERLVGRSANCFLLETFDGDGRPGKGYIGIDPTHHFAVKNGLAYKDGRPQKVQNPYHYLREQLTINPSLSGGYIGGLVGYASHESYRYSEPSLQVPALRDFYDAEYGLFDDGLIFDGNTAPYYFGHNGNKIKKYLMPPASPASLSISFRRTHKSFERYRQMVEKARGDITNGRVFQAVLANKYEYGFEGNLIALYKELRRINPSEYMFFIKFGDTVTMGASPELLAHVNAGRKLSLEALAGTIRRAETEKESQALAARLLADEKEQAEHNMLVDLIRNDVGKVSRISSVRIENLKYIKRLSHVQHLCSLVSGTLVDGCDAFDAVPAVFPTGTLVGAPKLEAAKMIAELEDSERGPYGGAVGYFSYNGEAMQAVNIRSVSASGDKLFMHSGSGIVYDSVPNREYDEINHKKAAMEKAMAPFIKETAA